MTYCISDIHGCYHEFMELLRKIAFSADDTLYILGDVIDRGNDSLKCLKYVMEATNIHMLMGNHEQMMINALTNDFNTDSSYMENWLRNGGTEVLPEFSKLPEREQIAILEYISRLPYLSQVKVGEQNYVLVHAGLNVNGATGNNQGVSTAEVLSEQYIEDLIWIRDKFFRKKALPKSITIFGHTPTPVLKKRNSGKVWRDKRFNDKLGIDGGCVYGGSLLVLRLDDMAEFAVEKHK